MGFIKRLADIFKNKSEEISWDTEFKSEGIYITTSNIDALKDLLYTYEIESFDNNKIFIKYEDIYDLYYDEYDNEIDTYKYLRLPDIFKGMIEVENKNNFIVDEEVKYIFKFECGKQYYKCKCGNILVNKDNEYSIMSKDLFELVKCLKDYNTSYEKTNDEASQFEMLKVLKDYSKIIDIKLNERLENEQEPIIIDKIKIDFNDDGQTIEVYPKLSDNEEENENLLKEIESFEEIKGSYYSYKDDNKIRYVIKHKDTLKNILENKTNTGQDRINILRGKSKIFEDENIDISDFGPRVTGFGYLTYRNSSSTVSNDLDWLDEKRELPYIQGSNINGDYENITLKPEDRNLLKIKLADMNFNNEESGIVEFKSDNGHTVNMIMTKDDIKNTILEIDARIKSPFDLKKVSDIENILKICDKYNEDSFIPYKGIYISKGESDIKEELMKQLDDIKSKQNKVEASKRKTLLIAENIEENEFQEKFEDIEYQRDVEIPRSLKEGIVLFDYQQECLRKLQNLYFSSHINGFLLCDDMGLGKTLQLLSFLAWLKERNELKPSLIVAPSSLLNNWDCDPDGEIQKFFGKNYFLTEKVVGSINSEKVEELKEKDIVFITYESLRINNVALGRINWKVMLCDEAQKIKSPRTLVTVAAKAQNADFKIICSATPIENTLEDLWTLVDFSKPGMLGSLKEFKGKYNNSAVYNESKLEEMNNELYDKIEKFYIRREKDVLPKALPKKRIKMYYVRPLQNEIDVLERIKDTEDYTISAIQKMLAVCSHCDVINDKIPTNTNIDSFIERSSKMKVLKNILEEIQCKNEKVIIFTRLKKVQKIIYFAIKKWFNMDCFIVNGDDNKLNLRTKKINDFRNSKGFNIIILSPEVAGFGITITEANHVIHYTRLWNPAKEDQATDRVYRIGQSKDVTVHYPIISFNKEDDREYDDINMYVEENSKAVQCALSPEEKLNILLARKKGMLLKFFLAAANFDISTSDFRSLDINNDTVKNSINVDNTFNSIITHHEFEALTALLYEKMGYKTYLTSRSNDKGVDVIAVKGEEILFIQCKHTSNSVSIEAEKDILFAKNRYKDFVDLKKVKGCIVTSSDNISASLRNSDIEIISREELAFLLQKYYVFKDEIDIKDNERYAFDEIKRILS